MKERMRQDIQVLRGFAVLIVLMFHTRLGVLPAGFLGVDVFFVISGFLMTRMIIAGIDRGNFSFAEFYFRRAKRLLPAAYATLLVTCLLSPLFLTSAEMVDFKTQLLGAVGFVANVVLWKQSDYFSSGADLKPLLHMWSLSIEEQYYFVLPAVLVLVPRRRWKTVTLAAIFGSFALCIVVGLRNPELAFYMLPTRGWEMALGSFGALVAGTPAAVTWSKRLFWPAGAALLIVPFAQIARIHPGPDALLLCTATLVVILRNHESAFASQPFRGIAKVGDISYSLYLVHWPLFAFLNNAWIGDGDPQPGIGLRVGVVILSFVLAYLSYRFVEVPTRRAQIGRPVRTVTKIVAGSLGIALLPSVVAVASAPARDYVKMLDVATGLAPACRYSWDFEPLDRCRTSQSARMLVWGDSFAMHLVPGLVREAGVTPSLIQATRSMCGPFLGLSVQDQHTRAWAASCIKFNDSVLHYLRNSPTVNTVVLSSPFKYVLSKDAHLLQRQNGSLKAVPGSEEAAMEALKRTVDAIHAMGKRVVIVAPPPSGGFNVGRCRERMDRGLPTLGVANDCNVSIAALEREQGEVRRFLAAVPAVAGAPVFDLEPVLCASGTCATSLDGVLLYRDSGHFSRAGSVLLANKVHLTTRLESTAE
jgi:peptidoglycan/LPS O-acetylase OafA/YrhL